MIEVRVREKHQIHCFGKRAQVVTAPRTRDLLLWTPDMIHPNASGQRVLEAALKKSKRS